MKKTISTQSLFNSHRQSLNKVSLDNKQIYDKQKIIQKNRIPSPITKKSPLQFKQGQYDQSQQRKNGIKEIYQYRIKERANKTKKLEKSKDASKNRLLQFQDEQNYGISKIQIEQLRLQNEQMLKQLFEVTKQNKNLKELLINAQSDKITKKSKNQKEITNLSKEYKKQMLNKLNDRRKLKTQALCQFAPICKQPSAHLKEKKDSKNKESGSKKNYENSQSNFTMNLNMSFVKIKGSSCNKVQSKQQKCSKSNSKKQTIIIKETQSQVLNHKSSMSIKSLFVQFSKRKQLALTDIEQFYNLNKKIFHEFNQIILQSKEVFTKMQTKLNNSDYFHSKKQSQDSKLKNQNDFKVSKLIGKIQLLYKLHQFGMRNEQFSEDSQNSGKRHKISEIERNLQETPFSAENYFSDKLNNLEREKSYEKYRLKKLNENLDLFANLENKKFNTEVTEPDSNQPKIYFSKPISTNISRKISFNNSCNNSLKNSKLD